MSEEKRFVIYSYIKKSKTLVSIQECLDNTIIVRHNEKFKPKDNDVIIFWGTSRHPSWYMNSIDNPKILLINNPSSISIARNKYKTFKILSNNNVLTPCFTADKSIASSFKRPFIVREILNGHSGTGIHIIKEGDEILNGKLYVEYIDKEKEYRVHIFNDEAIKISRKIARKSVDFHDEFVWCHNNGYYFNKVRLNEDAINVAKEAISTVGLNFGAVDIVKKDDKYYVLEINTAPGLQGKSIEVYVESIKKYANEEG